MRLSAAYNYFDGGELLVESVKALRPHVDHISVVTQTVSNYGNPQSPQAAEALEQLSSLGLIDDIDVYRPDLGIGGVRNQFLKRSRGLELARAAGCENFVFVDADEFYDGPSFVAARQAFEASNWRSSSVHVMNYYGKPTLRMAAPVGVAPFICRVSETHEFGAAHPYRVDPTRAVRSTFNTHRLFPATDIVMHHMTGVRKDIGEKLRNSSLNDDPDAIRYWRDLYAVIPHITAGRNSVANGESYEIEEVPDRFGLAAAFV